MNKLPKWTVLYNIVSKENNEWVGTGWEFFTHEKDAIACYERHLRYGNCPAKRPFDLSCDFKHLGAVHQFNSDLSEQ